MPWAILLRSGSLIGKSSQKAEKADRQVTTTLAIGRLRAQDIPHERIVSRRSANKKSALSSALFRRVKVPLALKGGVPYPKAGS